MSENSKENKEVSSSFTVDAKDLSMKEVPSVTRLLYKKSFGKSAISTTNAKEPQSTSEPAATPGLPPLALELTPTPFSLKSSGKPSGALPGSPLDDGKTVAVSTPPQSPEPSQSSLKAAHLRGASNPQKPLHLWAPAALRTGSDPLGQALASLLDSGVTQALFLSIQPVAGKMPVFVATAAVNAGAREAVWTGLRWDPSLLPGIWSQLSSVGFLELPPPGTMTNLHSERNVSRAAFDIQPEEGLYLARVGTPQQCRGIVVLISRKSLTAEIKRVAPMLYKVPSTSDAAFTKKTA